MRGRILAIDLGLKRTGLAVSDEQWITTRALPNLKPKSRLEDISYLLQIAAELEVKIILIGYPLLPQSGEEGFMAKRARGFFEALQKQVSDLIKVFLVNESYSSKEAQARFGKKRLSLELLDGESARIIIEDFIGENSY